jgi:hypothetical protein
VKLFYFFENKKPLDGDYVKCTSIHELFMGLWSEYFRIAYEYEMDSDRVVANGVEYPCLG